MLIIKDLEVDYGTKKIGPFNLKYDDNQIVSIIGPSGAGKTSLIKALANVIPFSGEVMYKGSEINKSRYTYITQNGTLFNHLTIKENLKLTVDISNAATVLEQLNIEASRLDSYPFELSGGERQRIDIARAILAQVDLLILDEAFNALDSKTKDDTYELIREIQKKYNMLVLNVTHDLQEAVILSDTVVLIADGLVSFSGTPKELVYEEDEKITNLISKTRIQLLKELYAND